MQLINKGKILRTFDKDAINFIDVAGLDNDVNLNVGGLYTAEQARMAVNNLVGGLKKYGLWNKCLALYPSLGGNSIARLNLKDTTLYTLTDLGGSYPNLSFNNKGLIGCAETGIDINSLSNNCTLCSYNIVDSTNYYLIGFNNSDNTLWLYLTDRIRNSSSAGAISTGARTGAIAGNISTNTGNIFTTHKDVTQYPTGSNPIPVTTAKIGSQSSGVYSNTSQNCVGVFSLLTASEHKQLINLLENFNVIINRSVR